MAKRWVRRRPHRRRLRSGRMAEVRETWILHDLEPVRRRKDRRYRHTCPHCSASIISVHMPNAGWAHFEGAKGLTRVKHPCLHRGLGLPGGRDELTLDLFEGATTGCGIDDAGGARDCATV